MVKFKGYRPYIDYSKLTESTEYVRDIEDLDIHPSKFAQYTIYDHAPHGTPKGKFSRGLTHRENFRYGKWAFDRPNINSEVTKRPEKRWKDYRPREYGYGRFPNPVVQSNKKIVFIGCGASSIGAVPWNMFSRPNDYQMWVVEPRTQHSVFFPSKLYDIFYFNREEDLVSLPYRLNSIIYPKGYGDTYWHRWPIKTIDPVNRLLHFEDELVVPYEFLVINGGAHANWEKIENLQESIENKKIPVYSLYYDKKDEFHHFRFKSALGGFKGGRILCYTPETKFSHPSTSASIVNLAYEKLSRRAREVEIVHFSPVPYTVGDSFVDAKIREKWKENNIKWYEDDKLVKIDGENRTAYFRSANGTMRAEKFDILHVTPPMSAIPAVRDSPELSDKEGWLDVDYYTFTHKKHPNIFGWGAGSNLPAPKTFYSSFCQTYNAILTLSYLTTCLERKDFTKVRNRNVFYGGEGYDVVHLGNRMTAVVGTKDHGKANRFIHFPYVWEAWDSQYEIRKWVDNYMDIATRPNFYKPDEIYQLIHKLYPLEPSKQIVDEWNSL